MKIDSVIYHSPLLYAFDIELKFNSTQNFFW